MDTSEQIYVLNIFHDGTIIDFSETVNGVMLTIEIEYLAELVEKNFSIIKCEFINCRQLFLRLWDNESHVIKELHELKKYDLEIIDAEIIDSIVVVKCRSDVIIGGNLFIEIDNIKIYDQLNREIPQNKLTYVKNHIGTKVN